MSLTPPKWIARQRTAEREKLLALAEKWEGTDLGASESIAGAVHGEATLKQCARELREALEH